MTNDEVVAAVRTALAEAIAQLTPEIDPAFVYEPVEDDHC